MCKSILFVVPVVACFITSCGGDAGLEPVSTEPLQAALQVSLAVDELGVGKSTTGIVTLLQPAPEVGAEIALSSTEESLALPPTIVVVAGERSATFALTNHYDGRSKQVTVVARYLEDWAAARLYVPVLPADVPSCINHGCSK